MRGLTIRAAPRIFDAGWLIFAVAMLAASAFSGVAEAKAKILDEKSVRQFIASYPDVKAVIVSDGAEKAARVAGNKDVLAGLIEVASDDKVKGRIDKAVKPHGFSGAKEWLAVAESVSRAYAHLKTGGGDDKKQKKLDKALAKIEKADFLSDEHKQKLIKQLRKGAGAATEPPPAENIEAVRPMVAQLDAVMK
ncbi:MULTISPECIES: hypothetical protein [Rhodomicrobium]|uniref:hypothetical protein n=1 Tax=Rhodomicrobium TaxID=1068 RepID=UPI000B4B7395|nr:MULTISPECIES: hypothetical protein [Rhodomicrobium]